MWPQTLQMTRDECRGILRRLELESYSQVISVFRAQGGLSESKAKILEELRAIFHISQERHRAEARRVANDEQLATIAEAISGPNTWQEWSREGRRPYPMLPRVAPQTALALIANSVAETTASENAKLPYPAETAIEPIKEDELQVKIKEKSFDIDRRNYVITSDPFKVPEIPLVHKKNLKRNNEQQTSVSGSKKRILNENSPQKGNSPQRPYTKYRHITANSTNSANNVLLITSGNHANSKKLTQQNNKNLQQQRFFHQQQQLQKQKLSKKAAAAANNHKTVNATAKVGVTGGKRQATPAKSGRRAQKLLEPQQQQLLLKQQQYDLHNAQATSSPLQMDVLAPLQQQQQKQPHVPRASVVDMHQFNPYTPQPHPPQQIFMDSKECIVELPTIAQQHKQQNLSTKRDITKNLNKVQIQQQQQQQQANDITRLSNLLPSSKTEKSLITTTSVQKYIVEDRQSPHATASTTIAATTATPSSPSSPSAPNNHGQVNNSPKHIIQVSGNMSGTSQQQILTLPQFSAAATKLRAINTTIIAPGTKLATATLGGSVGKKFTPISPISGLSALPTSSLAHTSIQTTTASVSTAALHELANVASNQKTQIFNIIDTTGGTQTNSAMPLHTSSGIIQLQNACNVSMVGNSGTGSGPAETQGKILTTKLLPIVLSGGTANSNNNNNSNISNISNNNCNSSSGLTNPSSINTLTAATGGVNSAGAIIKNFPSTLVLNSSSNNLNSCINISTGNTNNTNNNTIISTLNAGATVFRKSVTTSNLNKTPPNVSGSCGNISNSKSSGPHIISNVKLTPISMNALGGTSTLFTNTSGCGSGNTAATTTTNSTFKGMMMPSTASMMRTTSVKICQSPNGKVFIQSAGAGGGNAVAGSSGLFDANKIKLNANTLQQQQQPQQQQHKLLTNAACTPTATTIGASGGGGAGGSGSGGSQRIAIQKVQIIPAPLNPNTIGLGSSPLGNMKSSGINSPTIKSNMIIMPVSASAPNVRPVTLSKSSNTLLMKTAAQQQQQQHQHQHQQQQQNNMGTSNKGNIVILSNATTPTTLKDKMPQITATATVTATTAATTTTYNYDNNQLLLNDEADDGEDAPLDILNMPILMDPGVSLTNTTTAHSITETVTLLGNHGRVHVGGSSGKTVIDVMSGIGGTKTTKSTFVGHTSSGVAHHRQQQQQHEMLIDATDWELELDHAITTGTNNNNNRNSNNINNNNNNITNIKAAQNVKYINTKHKRASVTTTIPNTITTLSTAATADTLIVHPNNNNNNNSRQQHKYATVNTIPTPISNSISSAVSNIIVDDSFDDVIVEDREIEGDDDNDDDANNNDANCIQNAVHDDTNNNNNNKGKLLQEVCQQEVTPAIRKRDNNVKLLIVNNNKNVKMSTTATTTTTTTTIIGKTTKTITTAATSTSTTATATATAAAMATAIAIAATSTATTISGGNKDKTATTPSMLINPTPVDGECQTVVHVEQQQQQQQQQQHKQQQQLCQQSCEIVDAGFAGTIVSEIDENTAIEFITEDNYNQMPLITSPSTTALTTSLLLSSQCLNVININSNHNNNNHNHNRNCNNFLSNDFNIKAKVNVAIPAFIEEN